VSQDPLSDSTRSTVMPWMPNQALAAKGIVQILCSSNYVACLVGARRREIVELIELGFDLAEPGRIAGGPRGSDRRRCLRSSSCEPVEGIYFIWPPI
jgi:hypothetical protein